MQMVEAWQKSSNQNQEILRDLSKLAPRGGGDYRIKSISYYIIRNILVDYYQDTPKVTPMTIYYPFYLV